MVRRYSGTAAIPKDTPENPPPEGPPSKEEFSPTITGFDFKTMRGPEAIFPGSIWQIPQSFLIFPGCFGGGAGIFAGLVVIAILRATEAPLASDDFIRVLAFFALSGVAWVAIFGWEVIGERENAGIVSPWGLLTWWLVPPGFSFALPPGFGRLTRRIDVTELSEEMLAEEVETEDNVKITVELEDFFLVKWPMIQLRWSGDGTEVRRAFRSFRERNVRWFFSQLKASEAPAVREDGSLILAGKQLTMTVKQKDPQSGAEAYKVLRFAGSPDGKSGGIQETAELMGFEMDRVLIKDPSLPNEIIEAAQRKVIEKEELEAERTEWNGVIQRAREALGLRDDEPLDFKNPAHISALNYLQTERGKNTRILVEGSGDGLDRIAAGLLAGRPDSPTPSGESD